MNSIQVLVATCEGERWLDGLLKSLVDQERAADSVLIFDDVSHDNTVDIARRFRDRLPLRIMEGKDGRSGAAAAFSRLLAHCDGRYLLLADQDDVWRGDKIALLAGEMGRLEQLHGRDTPLLVYSDYRLIDERDARIADSGMRAQHFTQAAGTSLRRGLVQNVVPGCTVMINRALAELARPVPAEAVMHDWWLALVASGLGRVGYIDEPLVDYRQHGGNAVGASPWQWAAKLGEVSRPGIMCRREEYRRARAQAGAYHRRYAELMRPEDRRALEGFLELERQGYWRRRLSAARLGLRKDGWVRTAGLYWIL